MTTPTPAPGRIDLAPPPPPVSLDGPLPDPLAGLRDIHLPGPVPFWPPAPGWFILAGLVLAVAMVAACLEWRRRQTLAYQAQQELKAIARDGLRYPEARDVAAAAALLMRRIVLTRSGAPAAAVTGESWRRLLGAGKAGLPGPVADLVALAPYLPSGAATDPAIGRAAVAAAVRRWIRGNA